MSVRRTHAKTRTGCDTCKQRHIKCDELGPPCANCQVRGVECVRSTLRPPRPPKPADAAAAATTPAAAHTPSSPRLPPRSDAQDGNRFGSRLLELELLFQWTTATYKSFSLAPGDEAVWQSGVPQEALRHEFLLDAIFGITSLHMASTSIAARARTYHLAALEYHSLAISSFQTASSSLSPADYQAVFAFSVVNLALAIALPYHTPRDEHRATIVENLVTMFKMLQGTVSILENARTWLSSGPFGALFEMSRGIEPDALDREASAAFARLRAANDEGYLDLCSQRNGSSSVDAVVFHEANAKTIGSLERNFVYYEKRGPMRWLATLDRAFVEAIARLEPVAVLITMHWAILLNRFSDAKWWAQGSGKLLVTELSLHLMQSKPEWRDAAAWVHKQVGLPPLE